MRAKATPGPWKLILDDPEQRFEIHHESEASEPGCIAHVFAADADDMYSEAMANARLIAAAPDLLAALTDLLIDGHIDICPAGFKDSPHECLPICRSARAAIAKATGKGGSNVASE